MTNKLHSISVVTKTSEGLLFVVHTGYSLNLDDLKDGMPLLFKPYFHHAVYHGQEKMYVGKVKYNILYNVHNLME